MQNPIGVVSCHLESSSPEQAFERARDYGMQGIEWFEYSETPLTDGPVAGRIAALARDCGMANSYHAPWFGRWDLGCLTQQEAELRITEMLQRAHALDARLMTAHLGTFPEGAAPLDAVRTVASALQACARRAENLGTRIGVENFVAGPPDRCLAHSMAQFDLLFDIATSEAIGLTLDTGHSNVTGITGALLEKHGARLVNTHLHDNDGSKDSHRPPGDGTIDWGEQLRTFRRIAYRGPLVLEFHESHGRFADFIAEIRRY